MPESFRGALRVVAGAALMSALLTAAHGTASDPTDGALLRIALRTTAGTAHDCRRPSQKELDALPVHMRRPEVCETRAVPYRLLVRVDDRLLLDRSYTASGIHGDRPLVVGEELALRAGSHDLDIRFAPIGDGADSESARLSGAPAATTAPSPAFVFAGREEFAEGRIRVAALNAAGTAFELH